ncbi:MAG TPA: succinate dehydrogenase cytochrome b subunit [Planctomycetota bacterium]|nr:succinate dehydrogenase cytochrome b subunit [Planctomycetota bacterium]
MDGYLCRFTRSNIGLKVLMAVTGIVLAGFVAAHVSGNLLVFAGEAKMNAYAHMLKANAAVLWGARIVLLSSVVLHIVSAIKLYKRRSDARPVAYGLKEPHGSTYAARTMIWSGPILALFIVYHLLHFTVGVAHPKFDEHNAYRNVVIGFSSLPVVAAYVIAMGCLCLHLSHGVWSLMQTIGVNRPNWECALRRLAIVYGIAVCGGFVSIPLAVLLHIVKID